MTKWCPFCLVFFFLSFFFAKRKIISFAFSQAGRVDGFSFIHALLCFACTGGNALLQASVYFIPNRSHCCTEGIFFLFRVIILRELLMYKSPFCVERYEHQASRYCRAVDLEIWVLTFLPLYMDKSGDFLSSFKKPFRPYPSPAVLTEVGRKKPFKLLKEQIYDRQSFSAAWLNSAVAGIVLGERSEMKVLFRIALLQVYFPWHGYLT